MIPALIGLINGLAAAADAPDHVAEAGRGESGVYFIVHRYEIDTTLSRRSAIVSSDNKQ